MQKGVVIFCALLALPIAAALAQRGGGATVTSGDQPRAGRIQRPANAGAFEDLNPARMLVDKRKKLSLVDSQVAQMKAIEKRIHDRNALLLAEYDSVRKEIRFPNAGPAGGEMGANMGAAARGGRTTRPGAGGSGSAGPQQTPEAMARMREQLQALGAIGRTLQERRPADVAEALALLTPDQLAKAREFIVEQDDEFDRILPRGGRGG